MLRPYQQAAHDAAINWIKKSVDPAIMQLGTGAGKSHVIAALAETFHDLSGKHVLCTAPNSDLVLQNHGKFLNTGNNASIFSAKLGIKSLRHPVVFGTPVSIKNSIARFGSKFGLIIPDEGEGITPTIQFIVDAIRKENDKLRLIGLTATPFLTGKGLVYAMDENNKPSHPDECRDPYYTKKIYTIRERELIDQGYLTEPIIGSIHGDHYDTKDIKLQSNGKYNPSDIDRAFNGKGRKTAKIIEDIVNQSYNRNGVMIFAATVQHAMECMESLPRELSRMIGGNINTGKNERLKLVNDFKERKFKYLVSVGTMTAGVDFTHVDVIAILRLSESMRLLLQIIGRGSRVEYAFGYLLDTIKQRLDAIRNGIKPNFLVLDYADNFDRHCPDGDIYNPKIKAHKGKQSSTIVKAICELCKTENTFTARKNEDNLKWDDHGYFVDLDGNRIESEYGAVPNHYGRRCMGLHLQKNGKYEQCGYRWTFKNCPECNAENDIAARYCTECKAEIIDPNDKLIADFRAMKKDPHRIQCDRLLSWSHKKTLSKNGNECIAVDWVTEYRTFKTWHVVKAENKMLIKDFNMFVEATQGIEKMPYSITYRKENSGFYRIFAYNQEPDICDIIKSTA